MATRIFYQDKKLHSLISDNTTTSLMHTANIAHAERRTKGSGIQSLLLATNETGSVLQAYAGLGHTQWLSYNAYGEASADLVSMPVLLFNGERYESASECYALGNGHRLFSPRLMRFYSFDTLSPFDRGGINGYAYCGGDPVNSVDPSGRVRVTRWYLKPLNRDQLRGVLRRAEKLGKVRAQLREQSLNLVARSRSVVIDARAELARGRRSLQKLEARAQASPTDDLRTKFNTRAARQRALIEKLETEVSNLQSLGKTFRYQATALQENAPPPSTDSAGDRAPADNQPGRGPAGGMIANTGLTRRASEVRRT